MTNSAIAQIRLSAQQLAGSKLTTPAALVAHMGAMQAQDYNMAKWAIGVRLAGSTHEAVEAAISSGAIIRTHVLRPTWHFVAAEDIGWMLALTAPKIKSAVKSRDKELGLEDAIFVKSNAIIVKALEGGNHLTREELAAELEKRKISTDSFRISHIMFRAELDGLVCSGAVRGKKQTYALMDERVPATAPLTKDEAMARLAKRYFASHSPATAQDFSWWSGLSVTEARRAIEMLQPDVVAETIGAQTYWIDRSFAGTKTANKSFLLLPAFDEYIISYKDRTAVLPAENHSKAVSSNGIFRPIMVENGQVVGLWKKVGKKVETGFFTPPAKATLAATDKALDMLRSFGW